MAQGKIDVVLRVSTVERLRRDGAASDNFATCGCRQGN